MIDRDKDIITQSRNFIKEIVMKRLIKSELEVLIERYPYDFPGDYSLFKLASIYYYRLRDYESFRRTLERFIKDFPMHEYIEKAKKNLEESPPILPFTKTKIGVVLPLSGEAAVLGEKVLQGIQMAFNSLNSDERKVLEIVVRDSEGDTLKDANVVRELAQDSSIIAIIGPIFSKSFRTIAPIAEDFHLPVLSPSASQEGMPELNKYLFRNAMTNRLQGKIIAEYAINDLNMKRFVVIYPDDNYGRSLKDIFIENVFLLGGEVLTEESYSDDDTDFKPQIKGIGGISDEEMKKNILKMKEDITTEDESDKKGIITTIEKEWYKGLSILQLELNNNATRKTNVIKPRLKLRYDAIFIPGYYDKVGLIIPQLAFYNIKGVKCLGGNGWNSPDLVKIGGEYINGSIFVDGFFVDSYYTRTRRFVQEFRGIFRTNPDILSAQAYDAAQIIITILREGARTREDIRDALLMVKDYPGVSGKTTILPSGDSKKSLYILTVKDNKIVQIN
ncbi:MAG: penicillin-binding protein activator [Nitrospinae bacterium]|nr:penicillin-binding protein activator [Nitrospinota bacterium]